MDNLFSYQRKVWASGKDQQMYAMITNRKFSAITDEMINTVETILFPRMKSAGALDVYNIQTSENSATVVSILLDQAVADRAMEAVSSIRSEATSSFDSTIVSAQSGPFVVKA